jgi:single-stranded DNA-specific DHH superfamily exonuclease
VAAVGVTESRDIGRPGKKELRTRISWSLLVLFGAFAAWIYWPENWARRAVKGVGGTVQRIHAGENLGKLAVTLPDTVTDEDLEKMKALDQLGPVWLQLRGRQITGRGLASLTRLEYLRGLTLWGTSITDDDLVHLGAFVDLEVLNLDCNLITDKGLKQISALQRLRSVSLRGNPITAQGVMKLQAARPDLVVASQYEPPDD